MGTNGMFYLPYITFEFDLLLKFWVKAGKGLTTEMRSQINIIVSRRIYPGIDNIIEVFITVIYEGVLYANKNIKKGSFALNSYGIKGNLNINIHCMRFYT